MPKLFVPAGQAIVLLPELMCPLPDFFFGWFRHRSENADNTDGRDRDLVHGDGGTLGLGKSEDLNRDD
jgi:hypothetical protein